MPRAVRGGGSSRVAAMGIDLGHGDGTARRSRNQSRTTGILPVPEHGLEGRGTKFVRRTKILANRSTEKFPELAVASATEGETPALRKGVSRTMDPPAAGGV